MIPSFAMERTQELLFELMDTLGPSGNEENVRMIISREVKKYADEMKVDKMGNLIVRVKGKGRKAMLTAHMDEIGLMINKIEKNGHLKFSVLGGVEPITLAGQTVSILRKDNKDACKGVISFYELHEAQGIKNIPKIEDLYIDTGLTKKELAKKGIEIGSYIVTKHKSGNLGNDRIISGKALDNRVGVYILIQLIKNIKKTNLDSYFVFTVQEEVGLYGAKTSVYNISPDFGIAIDVTNSADSDLDSETIMGKGPVITVKDAEIIANRGLNEYIRKLAKKYKIPLQLEVVDIGTTDATSIMFSKGGVPSTVVSVPVRNLHSNIGVADFGDIQNAIKLMEKLLKEPPKINW
jgi:endoglucanase